MTQGIKAIGSVPVNTPRELRPFLQQLAAATNVRFGLGKNKLDRSPTVRELIAAGVLSSNNRGATVNLNADTVISTVEAGSNGSPDDYVPPHAPEGVTATVTRQGVLIAWNGLRGLAQLYTSHVEIWRAGPIDTEDFANYPPLAIIDDVGIVSIGWVNPAEPTLLPPFGLAGISTTRGFFDALPHSEYFIYFVRFVSHDNLPSAFADVNGLKVESSIDGRALLDTLADEVNAAQLNSVLAGAIEVVDPFSLLRDEFDTHETIQNIRELADIAKFSAEGVHTNARVLTEIIERETETTALAARATALEASIDDPTTGILARATALESFRTFVEDQGSRGFLATSDLFQGIDSSINNSRSGLLTRASALENFKSRVEDQGPGGFLATSSIIRDIETTAHNSRSDLLARASALENFRSRVENQGPGGFLATASIIRGIQATVNNVSADLITSSDVRAELDGRLSGRHFTRLDAGGRITGLEFFDGIGRLRSRSNFIIRADVFQIMTTTTGKIPFSVNGEAVNLDVDAINLRGQIPNANIGEITADKITVASNERSHILNLVLDQGYIGNAQIGQTIYSTSLNLAGGVGWSINKAGNIDAASINLRNSSGISVFSSRGMTGTHILDATVGTLKIGRNAVIVPAASSVDSNVPLGSSWRTMASIPIPLGTGSYAPSSVFVQAYGNIQALAGDGQDSCALRVRSSLGQFGGDVAWTSANGASTVGSTAWRFTGQSGTVTYYLEAKVTGGTNKRGRGAGIFVQGVRR